MARVRYGRAVCRWISASYEYHQRRMKIDDDAASEAIPRGLFSALRWRLAANARLFERAWLSGT
eukprot:6204503-Pleurochrysis_carterae.AAC.1